MVPCSAKKKTWVWRGRSIVTTDGRVGIVERELIAQPCKINISSV